MAWIYFAGFAFVVFVTHVSAFNDAEGRLFGLFQIDARDDVVHILSAVTGVVVAVSGRWIRPYFWATGVLYGADALVGLTSRLGLLDLSVFTEPWQPPDFGMRNLAINLPHIVIAGVAVVVALRASTVPPAANAAV
jgi:hypothetical protein